MSTPTDKHLAAARDLFPELCTGLSDDTAAFMAKAATLAKHFPAPALPAGDGELCGTLRDEARILTMKGWETTGERLNAAALRIEQLSQDAAMLRFVEENTGAVMDEWERLPALRLFSDAVRASMEARK